MALPSDSVRTAACCCPGDITVTKVHTGYLIGRALEPIGPGPWWEYVAAVQTFREAVHHACTVAKYEGVSAWLRIGRDDYRPLTDATTEPLS